MKYLQEWILIKIYQLEARPSCHTVNWQHIDKKYLDTLYVLRCSQIVAKNVEFTCHVIYSLILIQQMIVVTFNRLQLPVDL